MRKNNIKYSAPDIDVWEFWPQGLLCESQLEGIIPDDSEGIVF